jgi:hypothetical protein
MIAPKTGTMKYRLKTLVGLLALSLSIGGCYGAVWCPGREPLDVAATYRWLIAEQRYFEPLDAWVKNEQLEAFLLKAYREGGLEALTSRYGFDCAPRVVSPPCTTCFSCRRTISKSVAESAPESSQSCRTGEMSIQADIWKRPAVQITAPAR